MRRVLGRIRAHHVRIGILLYVALQLASNVVHNQRWSDAQPQIPRLHTDIHETNDSGPIEGTTYSLAYLHWPPEGTPRGTTPMLMLHGSPGSAGNFETLGRLLAGEGYDTYAIDLPGFAGSSAIPPRLSILAHAHAVLEFMQAKGIERAHVLGFSLGGGVGMHMSNLDPERVASLVMLSSIGVQETEGSGDYYFEHGKYAVGMVFLLGVRELVPDFGLLGPRTFHYAWLRNFWDAVVKKTIPCKSTLI